MPAGNAGFNVIRERPAFSPLTCTCYFDGLSVLYFLTVYIILILLLTVILKTPCKLHEKSLKILRTARIVQQFIMCFSVEIIGMSFRNIQLFSN